MKLENMLKGLWKATVLVGLGAILYSPIALAQETKREQRAREPTTITILDDSYSKRKIPDGFTGPEKIGSDPDLYKEVPTHLIPVISSNEPDTIEAYLKNNNPKAYAAFQNRMRWINNSHADLGRSDLLKVIAQTTRDLEGIAIKEEITGLGIYDEVLADIISDMHAEYFSRETFPLVMKTSIDLAKKDGEVSLNEVTKFAGMGFSFGNGVDYQGFNSGIEILRDPAIMKVFSDFYLKLSNDGIDIDAVDPNALVWVYKRIQHTDNSLANFRSSLSQLEKYVQSVEEIQEGLARLNGVRTLIIAVGRTRPDKLEEKLKEKEEVCLNYMRTLHERGERQIDKALSSFKSRGDQLTPELSKKLLKLHEYYGILQFSRLQENEYDFGLINELLNNTNPDYNKDKPLAVVTMPREGSEFIFDTFSMGNFYQTLKTIAKGYKLMVYSVATESGPLNALSKAYKLTGKKASVLVMGGHGTQTEINFGSDNWEYFRKQKHRIRGNGAIDYGKNTEDQILDITDKDKIKKLNRFLFDKAKIILYSCSTGKGRGKQVNIANDIAFNLPGKIIYAPDNITTGVEIALNSKRTIKDVYFLNPEDVQQDGLTKTYTVMKPIKTVSK